MDTKPVLNALYMYFRYYPNKPAAFIGLFVFALIDIYLILRIKFKKAPAFMFKLIPLATMETVGFLLRVLCIYTGTNLGKFLVTNLFTLVAPNVMILVGYNITVHVIRLARLETSIWYLQPKTLKIVSIVCTIAPSMIQGMGGIFQLFAHLRFAGQKMAITGLSIQLVVYSVFFVCLVYVTRNKRIDFELEHVKNPKRKALGRVYIALLLLLIRCIYRLVQFATGALGYLGTHEWTFYVFDALVAATVFLIFSTVNTCFPKRGDEWFMQKDEEEKSSTISVVMDDYKQ